MIIRRQTLIGRMCEVNSIPLELVKHSGMKTGQTLNVVASSVGKSIFWAQPESDEVTYCSYPKCQKTNGCVGVCCNLIKDHLGVE